jgi:unsaturated rhamnogalacturonyl hydrolase
METKGPSRLAPGREAGLALARAAIGSYPIAGASWRYEHGLLLRALRQAGDAWGDALLSGKSREAASALVAEDGGIRGYKAEDYNLDMINPGKNLLDLYGESKEKRLKAALDALAGQLRLQPRTASGAYWHKLIYPSQVWLDGLFMAQPFAIGYARAFGDDGLAADAVEQLAQAAEKTRDPRTGLLRHAWDEGRTQLWADPETGRSPCAWGRAMGWYAMALVDSIEALPEGHRGRDSLAGILFSLASALAEYQDESTGLWHQVVDQGGREGNYLETSVSTMLPYAFLKGARLGLLGGEFAAAAMRAYEGACARFLRLGPEGAARLEGTCAVAGLGGSPYRDGSFEYYIGEPVQTDDYKGVGPFILASIEYEAAARGSR